jgi:hypothetical protein
MERIPQADQASYSGIVCNQAGDPSTHRLPANHQAFGSELFHHFEPCGTQHSFPIGWLPFAGIPEARHVWEFESDDPQAALAEALGEKLHERRVHAGAGTVGQRNGQCGVGRAIDKQFGIRRQQCSSWSWLAVSGARGFILVGVY